jgi:RND family efflux transporter MFP subunit
MACGLTPDELPQIDVSGLPRTVARRTVLPEIVLAAGTVESSVQTVLRCAMENLPGKRSAGNRRGSTIVLSLVPEGTMAHTGDILCRLDASEHEELAGRQRIALAEAGAMARKASLDLEIAQIRLEEYVKGLCKLRTQEYAGNIALASAEVTRQADRLAWSQRMFQNGYVSRACLAGVQAALKRAEYDLENLRGEFRSFERFEAIRTRRELESAVTSARIAHVFQSQKLRAEQTRLADLERQIAAAIIRAPHDGQVIMAHKPKRDVTIEEGASVRQNQALIYLPDCSRLMVQVQLHETVLSRVRPGMHVTVRVEGSARLLQGELTSIDFLAQSEQSSPMGPDVRHYQGEVSLDEVPANLRLGMSAEVRIETVKQKQALVIPPESVRYEGDRPFCYVLARGGLERRAVSLGEASLLLQEVTDGIAEGEEVVVLGGQSPVDGGPANTLVRVVTQSLDQVINP